MKVGIIFPGYGSQFIGMGKEFYDSSRTMQEMFEEATQCLDLNFTKLCFGSSSSELAKFEKGYLVLFATTFAIAQIMKERGINISLVAGYDIGEYAAIAVGSGISLPDALYLLTKYATMFNELLEEKKYESIRVCGLSEDELRKICLFCTNGNQVSYISVQELENQFVVSGTLDSMNMVVDHLKKNTKAQILPALVGSGLHSPLMDDVVKKIKMYLEKVDFKTVSIPFVASVTGQALKDGDAVRAAVMQQIHAPLRWRETMEAFVYCDVIVTIGDCGLTRELCARLYPDKKVFCVVKPEDLDELIKLCGTICCQERAQNELKEQSNEQDNSTHETLKN